MAHTDTDRSMSTADIQQLYEEQAATFARLDRLNRILTGWYRRRAFAEAQGRVLDVACGTGINRRYLPETATYVGVDISREMLDIAEQRSDTLAIGRNLHEMDAQDLAFPDDCFDTVISALSTCTFPDPVAALNEMARVCTPDGRVLLVEHGKSRSALLNRLLQWYAPRHYRAHGCRLTQDPAALVEESALRLDDACRYLFGIITLITAVPGEMGARRSRHPS